MEHITTYTGEDFTPLEPDADQIHIEDIAHALSLMCRANGHFTRFYSVAQHSINCAKEAEKRGLSKRMQIACLLHDASEAYLSDITRPVKKHLSEYQRIEKQLQEIIYLKFLGTPLSDEEFAHMDKIDQDMLICEFNELMDKKVFSESPSMKSKPSFEFISFSDTENDFIALFTGKRVGDDLRKERKRRDLEEAWKEISLLSNVDVNNAYIAYFDVLGYRELTKERELIEICKLIEKIRILAQLEFLEQSQKEVIQNEFLSYPNTEKNSYEIKTIAFSDNIILSTLNNWRFLLFVMIHIQAALMKEGVFIRGAMVHGKIYHSETLVGGEGLIMAHEIETDVAVYPRIIVDSSYINAAKTASQHVDDKIVMNYLKLDFDENYFLDYFKTIAKEDRRVCMDEVIKAIERYKCKLKVLAKYKWCKTYHNNYG